MKSVCICSSFRFYGDVLKLEEKLNQEGIECLIPFPSKLYRKQFPPYDLIESVEQISEEEKLEEGRQMTLSHFERIDKSDVIYVLASGGYIGKSVSMEISRAYTKGKKVYSSEKLDDFCVMSLVDRVLSEEELTEVLKK